MMYRNSVWCVKGVVRCLRVGFVLTEFGVKLERRR